MTRTREMTAVEREAIKGVVVYLATPYSGYRAGFPAAADQAAKIAALLAPAMDAAVFSPIVHGHQLAVHSERGSDETLYQRLNEAMLVYADVLVVAHMDGWGDSVGVAQEIMYFQEAGKPIFDLELPSMRLTRRLRGKPQRDRFEDKTADDLRREHADWFVGARAG